MLRVAVSVSPPLLADTLVRLLLGRNLEVAMATPDSTEEFDVALVDTATPGPPAAVTLTLPRTLGGQRRVLVRDADGARFETLDGLPGIIDFVSALPGGTTGR